MSETPEENFIWYVQRLIDSWDDQERSKRKALEGLAFSLMVMLDGDSGFGPVKIKDEGGHRLEGLHELLMQKLKARRV